MPRARKPTRPTLADLPEHAKPEQVADFFGVGRTTIYDAIAAGQIPAVRLGRRLFVHRSALETLCRNGNGTRKAQVKP